MSLRVLTSDAARRKSLSWASFLLGGGVWLALCAASSPVSADQILLKNGHRLEGRIEPAGDGKIRVIVDEGQSVVVSSDQIAERIPGEAPIDAFEKRFARVPKDDRDGYIDLAAWGEER